MKPEIIKTVLKKFISDFSFDCIQDASIREEFWKNSYVAGGAIPSLMQNTFVNDVDIFLKDTFFGQNLKNHLFHLAETNCTEHTDELDFHTFKHSDGNEVSFASFISPHAISFNRKPKIQVITGFGGKPEEIIETFDWKHLKSYYDYRTDSLHIKNGTHELLLNKELVYTGSAFPLSSMMRMRKMFKNGWTIKSTEIIKMAIELSEYDLTDPNVLVRQMTGIDPLYINSIVYNMPKGMTRKEIINYIDEKMAEAQSNINYF